MNPYAAEPAYLSALKWANWPCHHREPDGSYAEPWDHPFTMIWQGRAHTAAPDKLGKTRGLMDNESNGWWGPDPEHWLIGRLYEAYLMTGDPQLRAELEQHARLLVWDMSGQPGWFINSFRAARDRGWRALAVVHLLDALDDGRLRTTLRDRALWTVNNVWMPGLTRADGWTDVRLNDNRLGPGLWVIPWQEAVWAYGAMRLADALGHASLLDEAVRTGNTLLEKSWRERDGAWECAPVMPLPTLTLQSPLASDYPRPEAVTAEEEDPLRKARDWVHADTGVPRLVPVREGLSLMAALAEPTPLFDQSFNYFGMCLAPWVVLRGNPQDTRAQALVDYLIDHAKQRKETAWLPPEAP